MQAQICAVPGFVGSPILVATNKSLHLLGHSGTAGPVFFWGDWKKGPVVDTWETRLFWEFFCKKEEKLCVFRSLWDSSKFQVWWELGLGCRGCNSSVFPRPARVFFGWFLSRVPGADDAGEARDAGRGLWSYWLRMLRMREMLAGDAGDAD